MKWNKDPKKAAYHTANSSGGAIVFRRGEWADGHSPPKDAWHWTAYGPWGSVTSRTTTMTCAMTWAELFIDTELPRKRIPS